MIGKLDTELECVRQFGKFSLQDHETLYHTGTIIQVQGYIIAADRRGKIHIHSMKRKQTLTFKGAGGRDVHQIMFKDNILYQSCCSN